MGVGPGRLFLGLIGAVLGFMAPAKRRITAAPNKQNTATRSESVPPMVFTNAGVGSAGATPAGGIACLEQMYWDGTTWTGRHAMDGDTWLGST